MGRQENHIKTQDVVVMFTVQHLSSGEIQRLTGMSRAGIIKRLNKAGIDTSKQSGFLVTCNFCGKEYKLLRCRWRKVFNHYCSNDCYHASLENPGYRPWRQGTRLARAIVAQHFNLKPEHIVHHEDGDNRNNALPNLRVFNSHADHMSYERGNPLTVPIWDGSKI